jgi:hypothetical protein
MPVGFVVRAVVWLWFAGAVFAGYTLALQRLPPLAVPGIIFGLAALLIAAYLGIAAFRQWVDAIDLRSLVLLHVTRFVGVVFLVLYRHGRLPYEFAVPGGIGDIVVALFALPVALAPLGDAARLRAISIWNIAGLADILLVVVAAIRLNVADPLSMRALTQLPLSLLPTFLVPIIVATHAVIFIRLAQLNRAT